MTRGSDRLVEERLGLLAEPAAGDWDDVRRRADRITARTNRAVLTATVLVLLLVATGLVALPAFGLGQRLVDLFTATPGDEAVPVAAGTRAPVPYVLDGLFFGLGAAQHLARPLSAPLLGEDELLAVPSPDRRLLVYATWQSATPTLRVRDLRTGTDVPLEPGTQSAAWRQDGALAYWRATRPAYGGANYVGQVVVRSAPGRPPHVWTRVAASYTVSGWAGRSLIVTARFCLTCRSAVSPGVLVADGPGRLRRVGLRSVSSISPDGRYLLGTYEPSAGQDGPSPLVRVVEVKTGRVVQQIDLRRAAGPTVPSRWLAAGVGSGSWVGDHIVALSAYGDTGTLVFLTFRRGRLQVDRIARLALPDEVPGGYGPFFSTPLFLDRRGNRVIVAIRVLPKGPGREYRAFLNCDTTTFSCVRGVRLPDGKWASIVADPSRPLGD